jgi:hypothetical protein
MSTSLTVFVFVIDATYHAVVSGMFATVVQSLRKIIEQWKGGNSRTRVCFILFDSSLHFFSLKVCKGHVCLSPFLLLLFTSIFFRLHENLT